MICSEARLAANRANGSRSKGPLSPETRAISARNSFKHGLSGKGIVASEADAEEIARRAEDLKADLKPRTEAGVLLVLQMAMLSVRFERAAEQESAAIARNVRHAPVDFDEERFDEVDALIESLGENPRANLRRLSRMPEGVERLIEEWGELRNDLTLASGPSWTGGHFERAAHLAGLKAQAARASRLGTLTRALEGDFSGLPESDGGGLTDEARRAWAKAALIERVDAEVATLEAHYETLDFETIALDRSESGARALFDASKPACLARRYESEASRRFFKCLKEFRQVEAEFAAQGEAPGAARRPVADGPIMGSSREIPAPLARELTRAFPDAQPIEVAAARRPVSPPDRRTRRPKLPR